jgi:hypothetical protein
LTRIVERPAALTALRVQTDQRLALSKASAMLLTVAPFRQATNGLGAEDAGRIEKSSMPAKRPVKRKLRPGR